MSSWFGVLLNTGTNSAFTFYPGNIIYELNNFEQLIINDVKNKFINLFWISFTNLADNLLAFA